MNLIYLKVFICFKIEFYVTYILKYVFIMNININYIKLNISFKSNV